MGGELNDILYIIQSQVVDHALLMRYVYEQ